MAESKDKGTLDKSSSSDKSSGSVPAITLPKGGGAIRGIGEKFAANPVTGTGSMTVPIATSPGRSGFGPQLSLSYDSGSGNGPFGLGWNLSLASIMRKTDKGLPRYRDADDSDVFILSGSEDLVPILKLDNDGNWRPEPPVLRVAGNKTYGVRLYRPRTDGLFARIERWTNQADQKDSFWRFISKDNITTWYGRNAKSRIADPFEPARIFSWLICESYDDKGNAIFYEYREEDSAGVDLSQANEKNRTVKGRSANRYLWRIKYGNKTPRLDGEDLAMRNDWLFETVFDYEEGYYDALPSDAEGRRFVRANKDGTRGWPVRKDPFSGYRAGFEVRTYRLCRRVLTFHHFPGELGTDDYLVRSTGFDYSDFDYSQPSPVKVELAHEGSTRFASFITGITQSGYVRRPDGTYLKKSAPSLEFTYSRAEIDETVCLVDSETVENLPIGLDGSTYQWVDLDGEGLSGILTEQADAWFYKRNLGGRFGPVELVAERPSLSSLNGGKQQLLDLAGDGRVDLVQFSGPMSGFYDRTSDNRWERFVPFASDPNISWNDPNLKFIDLTGDGHADILISEDEVFIWYQSLAKQGFEPSEAIRKALDEEAGACLIFADATRSIYLADMSGDGLTDIVRIRNGEVCYWPNLGYGHFGPKVTMDNAPWFDHPDRFDQRRIRLADIDGSGVTDIIYLGSDGIRLCFNQSGNSWSGPYLLSQFPDIGNSSSVTVVDLLGNGTACLVWSSPLPGGTRCPMRYIRLMSEKPHLLIKTVNNLGAETRVRYASSTKFYLEDKRQGKPWITKLPFPVHVAERVETCDRISCNRFITRYAYHHGYFDGEEREFRGFGMVEQWDTVEFASFIADGTLPDAANIDAASHVPPVLTRTWFHTGVYTGRDRVSGFYAGLLNAADKGEYFREPAMTDAEARDLLLPDTVLPPGLTLAEEREACRALKGSMLRQEVYALDGSDKEAYPYTVTEQNFTIECLQGRGGNRHAVFFTHARESLSYQYERNPADPRVQHALTLEVDAFGNVLKKTAICYGRRSTVKVVDAHGQVQQVSNLGMGGFSAPERDAQTSLFVTYTENRVTNAIETVDARRNPLPCETRTFELTGYPPTASAGRFQPADFVEPDPDAPGRVRHVFLREFAYEETATGGKRRRQIELVRTLYRKDDLSGLLPLGQLASLGLSGEGYRLAFTPGLLAQTFQRLRAGQPPEALLPDPVSVLSGQTGERGGYVQSQALKRDGYFPESDAEDHWWVPSGRSYFSIDPADDAAAELVKARQHFFFSRRYRDPFGQNATISFDAHDLLMAETCDALGNRVTADENDYRVLQPRILSDPNRNRTAVAFDALGMVTGTAVMGKAGSGEGDSLAGFEADLPDGAVLGHLANPFADPHPILGRATTRLIYDLFACYRTKDRPTPQPAVVYTMGREIHDADLASGEQTRIQHGFSYSDGFGREIQKKIQAEPGPLFEGGPSIGPRWVGSGWTVFNNKGKPVRQYEPFFTAAHGFEFEVKAGVSRVLFYDPAERVVATRHPNHTWEKVVFCPWRQETWDVNDTVTIEPRTDGDVRGFFVYPDGAPRLSEDEFLPTWYSLRTNSANAPAANQLWPDPSALDAEKRAAEKASVHSATPVVAHADSLGRAFLTVTHNKFKYGNAPVSSPPVEEFYRTRVILDIEGNQRGVVDANERVVMRYDYDMLGNRIRQSSMEAGERWMLSDAAGKPIYACDGRGHRFRTAYDTLRRPMESFLRDGAGVETLVGRIVYGETRPNAEADNLRGKVVQVFDQAGVVTTDEYDFKGNLLRSRRRFARSYKTALDWSAAVPLEGETYAGSTRYDALNRPVRLTAPYSDRPGAKINVLEPVYNEANLLEQVHAWLDLDAEPVGRRAPAAASLCAIVAIDYNARGQRTFIDYGNGVSTAYGYDPLTFRLTRLFTGRGAAVFSDDCPEPPQAGWPGSFVQNLRYIYDPAGNITGIRDGAQQTVYFRNRRVEPSAEYTYDAVYRLIEATGREHLGQGAGPPVSHSYNDVPRVGLLHPGDGGVMGRYLERYIYDAVGNFLSMRHSGSDPANPGWTRDYDYNEPSLLEPDRRSNRLTGTTVGGTAETCSVANDGYDAHGNMLRMPHLQIMQWDFKDQLRMTRRQAVGAGDADGVRHEGERTWYVYDSGGQRVRKVTERQAVAGQPQTRMKERIYLSGFEVYREYEADGASVSLERETLHVMDDKQRVALIETRTGGEEPDVPQRLIRYQLGNHLGSACLELDEHARIISYEEYTPYGDTSYEAVRSLTETPKRYRYTGKERDEENGFTYHGARYYAPWLGRWMSCDPIGLQGGIDLYSYVKNNPVMAVDPFGTDDVAASGVWDEREQVCRGAAVPIVSAATLASGMQGGNPLAGVAASFSTQRVSIPALRLPSDNVAVRASGAPRAVTGRPLPPDLAVDPLPTVMGFNPGNPGRTATSGEHALGMLEVTREEGGFAWVAQDSPYVAMSRNVESAAFGNYDFEGPRYLVDLDAIPPSTPIIENSQVIESVQQLAADPARVAAEPSLPGRAANYVANQPFEQEIFAGGHVPPEAVQRLDSARVTLEAEVVAPTAASQFLTGAGELGMQGLKLAGQALTVYGAFSEARRTAELERRNNRGELNTALMFTATFYVGVGAGVLDDALAATATAATGSPAPVMDSWEHYGAGPIQHLAGEAMRGFLDWGARSGW